QNDRALGCRQLGQGFGQGRAGRDEIGRILFVESRLAYKLDRPRPAQPIETRVIDHAVEAGPERRLSAEARESDERLDVRVLQGIVHLVAVAEQSIRQSAEPGIEAPDQGAEGALVSGARLLEQAFGPIATVIAHVAVRRAEESVPSPIVIRQCGLFGSSRVGLEPTTLRLTAKEHWPTAYRPPGQPASSGCRTRTRAAR